MHGNLLRRIWDTFMLLFLSQILRSRSLCNVYLHMAADTVSQNKPHHIATLWLSEIVNEHPNTYPTFRSICQYLLTAELSLSNLHERWKEIWPRDLLIFLWPWAFLAYFFPNFYSCLGVQLWVQPSILTYM